MKTYVVDACNVIFKDKFLEDTLDREGFPAVRQRMIEQFAPFVRREGLAQMLLVFDGSEKAAHRTRIDPIPGERLTLVYADPDHSADRHIIEMIEGAAQPGQYTVVTADKFIARHVRGAGGKVLDSGAFLRAVRESGARRNDPFAGEDPRKFAGLSDYEVERWMKIFGFEEGE